MTAARRPSVVIDALPESAARHRDRTIVAIDVIRATTVAMTAVAAGRRCLVARDVDDALVIRDRLGDVVLAGELAGEMPPMFDMNNSPAELAARTDVARPIVMVSSSGAVLLLVAAHLGVPTLVACLRNAAAVARHLIAQRDDVALIGAGSRGEFREEDQLCCAWIGRRLVDDGFEPADAATAGIIRRWGDADVTSAASSNSVGYLRRSGQLRDWDFVASHIDDLDVVASMRGNEVTPIPLRTMATTPR